MAATLDGRVYDQHRDQRSSGQVKFKMLLYTQFEHCWNLIATHGFQTGWKRITNKPQHGNHNPNWKDCLDFVEAGFRHGKHLTEECVKLPILKGLPVEDELFTSEEYWRHMWDVCKLHQDAIRYCKNAKWSGLIGALYPLLLKRPITPTEYIKALIQAEDEDIARREVSE